MQIPPWLMQLAAQRQQTPPTAFMGQPDFATQPMGPMSMGGRYGGPPMQSQPPLQPGPTGSMSDQAMNQAFPAAMGAGGGTNWGQLAGMAGGLLSEQAQAEQAPPPQWMPQQATPMGQTLPSAYEMARMRGRY